MRIRSERGHRAVVAAAAAAVLLAVQPAAAQEAMGGPRWQAWLGCWESTAQASAPVDAPEETGMVCVVPTADADAVEIITVEGGAIDSRSTLRADGEQHAAAREGCAGWDRVDWSADGTRAYLHSEYTCEGGLERRSSGVMALAPSGDWIDVRAVTAGGNSGVHAVRYRSVTRTEGIPAELAGMIENRALASNAARMAASARVTPEDVIEASQRLDPLAVEAWLIERDQAFMVDGRTLTMLADAQVPTRVIDLLVALSYPEVFALDDSAREQYGRAGRPPIWDPWGYPGYGGGYYPYGRRYGGWYSGYPNVIIIRQPSGGSGTGGKAVKGRGYSRGEGGSSAAPTARPSSGGDASRAGGGGGSGSSGGRKAKPKDN